MIKECPLKQQTLVIEHFERRFGIERCLFKDFAFFSASKGRVFLGPKNLIDRPPPETGGILIARISRSVKPTTNFFQIFGKEVKNNLIPISREKALRYIRGEDLEVSADEIRRAADGYILLTYLEFPLGCGLLKGKRVRNVIPKAKRQNLEFL